MRSGYCGLTLVGDLYFDTEMVSSVIIIDSSKRGKASDVVGLTAEHLLFSHPVLSVILSKLFQLVLTTCHIPNGFKHSYIMPIPKTKNLS